MTQTTNQAPTSPTRPHVPRGFIICMGAVLLTLVCAAVSLFDDREFYSDIFVEVSVFAVFVAGFFTNTRTLQFGSLLFANLYSIMFLAIFGKVFYDNYSQGVGILVLIQIIFSTINLVPILLYHLTNRTFFYSYQRQLIYPTLFFAFVLLGHLPGGDVLTAEVSHEIFSLIIFAQAFAIMDAIHKVGKAHHMAAYAINTQPLGTKLVPDTDDADDSEGSLDEPEDVEE